MRESIPDQCQNCGATLHGEYCAQCGQRQRDMRRFLLALINEAFEDVFQFDSRAWRTSFSLWFKPGFLTREYFAGRRVRYVPPLRLYVITSLAFFLTLSLVNFFSDERLQAPSTTELELTTEAGASGEKIIHEVGEGAAESVDPSAAEAPSNDAYPADAADETDKDDGDFSIGEVSLPFLNEAQTQHVQAILDAQAEKAEKIFREDPQQFADVMLDLVPPIAFLLLPVFALLLKIMYIFRRMYYTEHLVLAVHNQSFLYSALLMYALLTPLLGAYSSWPEIVLGLYIPIYMLLSLKAVYQQSWLLTWFKFIILTLTYMTLLGLAMMLAAIVGFLTL
ncbi:MAG: DUF3667 domain-containing protein [Gammaproteobacteria bacterium]|nr:DUF3667 domain-containing protein [Gammaproteobacteria bacterium]